MLNPELMLSLLRALRAKSPEKVEQEAEAYIQDVVSNMSEDEVFCVRVSLKVIAAVLEKAGVPGIELKISTGEAV